LRLRHIAPSNPRPGGNDQSPHAWSTWPKTISDIANDVLSQKRHPKGQIAFMARITTAESASLNSAPPVP